MRTALLLALMASFAIACESDYPIWIPRTPGADPLYRFVKNGRAGYIDQSGHIVIPPKLELEGNSRSEFHDGLLEIGVFDGKYVDRTGEVVLDKGLYRGWDFSEGLAVAMRKDENLWGYINTSGEFAITPRFETGGDSYVWPFADGLAKIKVHGKYGYIDHSGKFVIPPQFPDGVNFHDGMARVVTDGPCTYFPEGGCGFANPEKVGGESTTSCRFTFTDKTGRVITTERFDNARDFSEGLAPVQIGKLWAFIDKTGRIDIPPRFEDAYPFHSGLARIRDHNWYGYADKSGNIVIRPQWTYAEDFSEDIAVAASTIGRYFYIDRQGKRAFPGEFTAASPFFKGLANVRFWLEPGMKSWPSPYIVKTGRRVFTY